MILTLSALLMDLDSLIPSPSVMSASVSTINAVPSLTSETSKPRRQSRRESLQKHTQRLRSGSTAVGANGMNGTKGQRRNSVNSEDTLDRKKTSPNSSHTSSVNIKQKNNRKSLNKSSPVPPILITVSYFRMCKGFHTSVNKWESTKKR